MATISTEQFLTNEEIQWFEQITRAKKRIELRDDEALDQGMRLILLVELLIKEFTPVQLSDKDIVAFASKRKENCVK